MSSACVMFVVFSTNQIAETCERQLAIQHKLAPIGITQVEEGLNGEYVLPG